MGEQPGSNEQQDPNAPVQLNPAEPGGEPGGDGTPAQPPNMVPLPEHLRERRKYQGQIASLSARLQELERNKQHVAQPGNQSEDDRILEQWHERLKLKAPLEQIKALQDSIKTLQEQAALGSQAYQRQMASANRAMDKAEKIAVAAFDKDLKGIGFNEEGWQSFVAGQMTDEDMEECFANPGHMREVVKRCRDMMVPKINALKTQTVNTLRNMPVTPGPGGNPPGTPPAVPLKGKALHARAFERLSGAMQREG